MMFSGCSLKGGSCRAPGDGVTPATAGSAATTSALPPFRSPFPGAGRSAPLLPGPSAPSRRGRWRPSRGFGPAAVPTAGAAPARSGVRGLSRRASVGLAASRSRSRRRSRRSGLGRGCVGRMRARTRASPFSRPNNPVRGSARTSNSACCSSTPRWSRARSLASATLLPVVSTHSTVISSACCGDHHAWLSHRRGPQRLKKLPEPQPPGRWAPAAGVAHHWPVPEPKTRADPVTRVAVGPPWACRPWPA